MCVGGISAANTHKFSATEPGALHWLCSAPRRGQREGCDYVLSSVSILGINKSLFKIPHGILLDDTLRVPNLMGFFLPICRFFFNVLKSFISFSVFELGVSLEGSRKLSWIVLTALLPSSLQSSCAAGCSICLGCSSCIQPLKGLGADNILVSPLCQLNLVISDPEKVSAK